MPPTNSVSPTLPLLADDSPPLPQPPLPSFPPHQSPPGVANCNVFKSRLQEYAQKVGIPTPVYETVKEGPSHEPVFKSTVVVNDVRYESLPGFFNRKAAEQSAAEVALLAIRRSGHMQEASIPTVEVKDSSDWLPKDWILEIRTQKTGANAGRQIKHETGLCKNLLQEYAQKMNYAIPSYVCTRSSSGSNPHTCTVDIGGIQYIGAAARTKKEAEIKAARTALLAIQSQSHASAGGASLYTVLPGKKKPKEQEMQKVKPAKQLKPKKANFKNRCPKKRFPRNKNGQRMKTNNEESQDIINGDTTSCTLSKEMEMEMEMINDKDSHVHHEDSIFCEIPQGGNAICTNAICTEVNNC